MNLDLALDRLLIGPPDRYNAALAEEQVWRLGWLDLNPAPTDDAANRGLDASKSLNGMVGATGIEPVTPTMST